MKLAEGLSIRKDLQTRIEQIKARLLNNMKVQEGDQPTENPAELMKELDGCLKQLEEYIFRINATNMHTVKDGKTLTQMMAERDVLGKRLQVLREAFDRASQSQDRYGRNEIKYITTIDVPALRKQIDQYAQQFRLFDMEIQALNFSTELE
ncbi:MAG: DIP1984 family protein [Prevotella sp.]|nr:DIP1984 family protein [Prevotella sp.]